MNLRRMVVGDVCTKFLLGTVELLLIPATTSVGIYVNFDTLYINIIICNKLYSIISLWLCKVKWSLI